MIPPRLNDITMLHTFLGSLLKFIIPKDIGVSFLFFSCFDIFILLIAVILTDSIGDAFIAILIGLFIDILTIMPQIATVIIAHTI